MRAFSTFRILPRIGRIAWNLESRPPLAEPPAESPSTTYSSDSRGSVDWQSASLPGSELDSSRPLRRVRSRACRAARRARAAWVALRTIDLPSVGLRSNQSRSHSPVARCTNDLASELPSLVFVCPSNCGSAILRLMIAVRPSRMSEPSRLLSFSLRWPLLRAQSLKVLVSAERKPSSWVPPSWVLIVLAKV